MLPTQLLAGLSLSIQRARRWVNGTPNRRPSSKLFACPRAASQVHSPAKSGVRSGVPLVSILVRNGAFGGRERGGYISPGMTLLCAAVRLGAATCKTPKITFRVRCIQPGSATSPRSMPLYEWYLQDALPKPACDQNGRCPFWCPFDFRPAPADPRPMPGAREPDASSA